MGIQGHGDKTLEQGRPKEEHEWLITEEQMNTREHSLSPDSMALGVGNPKESSFCK